MMQGNRSSKLNDGPSKAQVKSTLSKTNIKNNKLPEKTKFTTQYRPTATKNVKNADRKITSVTASETLAQRSAKTNLPGPRVASIKKKDYLTSGNVRSGPIRTTEERKIKAGSSSVPSISSLAPLNQSPSVMHSRIATMRKVIKTTEEKRTSSTSKSTLTSKPLCERRGSTNIQKYKEPSKSKVDVKSGTVKTSTLKKSTTYHPEMKLKENEKSKVGRPSKGRSTAGATLPGVGISKNTDMPIINRETPVGKLDEENRSILRYPAKERSKSQEVKRMRSKDDWFELIQPHELAQRKYSDNTGLCQKHLAKQGFYLNQSARLGNTELNWEHVERGKVNVNFKDEEARRAEAKPKANTGNQVLQVHNAEVRITGSMSKDDFSQKVSCSHHLKNQAPEQGCSLQPIDNYDSFLSLEQRNSKDDILNLDKRIWSELELQIRETCDKTDFLEDNDDDESLSEIIHQLTIHQEEPAPETKTKMETQERVTEPATDGGVTTNIKSTNTDLTQKSWESNEKKPAKATGKPESKSGVHPEPKRKTSAENPVTDKTKVAKTKILEAPATSEGPFPENQKATDSIVQNGFFKTHRNVCFIGKDVDQAYVSFEIERVKLYQPHESQMLFHDIANCIATQAYLKMCGISYELEIRKNAENMSPSGRVPFICSSLCIIPEFEAIVSFMQFKKFTYTKIEERDKPAFRAIMSMIVNTLEQAERYICWYDDETSRNYTKPRIEDQYPFPLNHIMHLKKRFDERKRLADQGVTEKSFDAILSEINSCFRVLSQRLGNNNYFFGGCSTEIDALVYGHIYALFSAELNGPFKDIRYILHQYPNIASFAINFDKQFSLDKFSALDMSHWENLQSDCEGLSETSFDNAVF